VYLNEEISDKMETKPHKRVTVIVNSLSERERNDQNFLIHAEREREGERDSREKKREREMMFTTSHTTITVRHRCPQKHKKQRTTNKKTTKMMTIKAMAKKGGRSGSNNDEPEGFGFPKRYGYFPSSFSSSRR